MFTLDHFFMRYPVVLQYVSNRKYKHIIVTLQGLLELVGPTRYLTAPPVFAKSVYPILTRGAYYGHKITTCPPPLLPGFSDFPKVLSTYGFTRFIWPAFNQKISADLESWRWTTETKTPPVSNKCGDYLLKCGWFVDHVYVIIFFLQGNKYILTYSRLNRHAIFYGHLDKKILLDNYWRKKNHFSRQLSPRLFHMFFRFFCGKDTMYSNENRCYQ